MGIGGCWWWVGGGEWWRKIASKNRLWQTVRWTLLHIELLLQLKRGLLCHNIKMSCHYLRVQNQEVLTDRQTLLPIELPSELKLLKY